MEIDYVLFRAICKAVISSSFWRGPPQNEVFEGQENNIVKGRPAARNQHTAWLRDMDSLDGQSKGVGILSLPTMMSSHVLIFHFYYQRVWNARDFFYFFVFVSNVKMLKTTLL